MGCSCSDKDNKVINEVLQIHNENRKKHNSQPLIKNETLNDLAKDYAKQISKGNTFSNNIYKGIFLGENIYIFKGEEPFNPKDMCDAWYNEIKNYDKNLNEYQKNTSHFTQMIWKETKEIGFACKKVKRVYYAVALYYPPGNTLGEYKENVLFTD